MKSQDRLDSRRRHHFQLRKWPQNRSGLLEPDALFQKVSNRPKQLVGSDRGHSERGNPKKDDPTTPGSQLLVRLKVEKIKSGEADDRQHQSLSDRSDCNQGDRLAERQVEYTE